MSRGINHFPKLDDESLDKVLKWLEREKHECLAKFHNYSADGNELEAEKNKAGASKITYIEMMVGYQRYPERYN